MASETTCARHDVGSLVWHSALVCLLLSSRHGLDSGTNCNMKAFLYSPEFVDVEVVNVFTWNWTFKSVTIIFISSVIIWLICIIRPELLTSIVKDRQCEGVNPDEATGSKVPYFSGSWIKWDDTVMLSRQKLNSSSTVAVRTLTCSSSQLTSHHCWRTALYLVLTLLSWLKLEQHHSYHELFCGWEVSQCTVGLLMSSLSGK